MIESLEEQAGVSRASSRLFPGSAGLYQCPTIVNNVETLCAVKHIVAMGGVNLRSWAREQHRHAHCEHQGPREEAVLF